MAEQVAVTDGTPVILSIGIFIVTLAVIILMAMFVSRRRSIKGVKNALLEQAKLEGKQIISSEEANTDVVVMAHRLADMVDALAEERSNLTAKPDDMYTKDKIRSIEENIIRGASLLNKTIQDAKEVSPDQLAQVRDILQSIGPEIKAERYSALKNLLAGTRTI